MRRPFAIALIVAMLALAGIALHFRSAAETADARSRALARELAEARFEARQHRERADAVEAQAAELDSQLGSTKIRTTATETKAAELTRALSERQQREVTLLAEIESLRQQARTTVAPTTASELSNSTSAVPPPATLAPDKNTTATAPLVDPPAYARRIAALEAQLTELLARALETPLTPADTHAPSPAEALAAAPAHQVVRVGAQAAFVIIDYGADHGARAGQELTLARGTSLIARVQISDVRPKFSIAQVLPDGPKRQLQTGDIVLLAQ